MWVRLWIVVTLFFLVFGFQINGINSRYIVYIIICIIFIKDNKIEEIFRLFKNQKICLFVLGLLFYSFSGIIITFIHGKCDLSFFIQTFGICILQIFTLLYCNVFFNKRRSIAIDYIITIYVIQSLIIFAGFVFPEFLSLVRNFQFENIQERSDQYLLSNVYRGLSLSGDLFFGLSASFGMSIIFCAAKIISTKSKKYIVALIIILAASFFVGRTSQVGLMFAIILIIISSNGCRYTLLKKTLSIICITGLVIGLFIPDKYIALIADNVLPYALELFYNLSDSNELSSSSTNDLLNMLDKDIPIYTILFGDGLFSIGDGYYMNIDVGYYRQLFFGGISMVIYSILYYIYILFPVIFVDKKIRWTGIKKEYLYLSIIVALYLFTLHIKGLTMMHCREISILTTIYFYNLFLNERNSIRNSKIIE